MRATPFTIAVASCVLSLLPIALAFNFFPALQQEGSSRHLDSLRRQRWRHWSSPLPAERQDHTTASEETTSFAAQESLDRELVLREFRVPLQSSPRDYEAHVHRECCLDGDDARVVRWHISSVDKQRGDVQVEVSANVANFIGCIILAILPTLCGTAGALPAAASLNSCTTSSPVERHQTTLSLAVSAVPA